MEERKGDVRIIIICGLMFLCIIAGGLLLCLYLFVPESQSQDWYSVVGITLVATPWIFWILVYLHHCFKPTKSQSNGFNHSSSCNRAPAANNDGAVVANLPEVESPDCDSPADGKRRVHFGAVVVMGNKPCGKKSSPETHSKDPKNTAMHSKESEAPLRLPTSSS